MTVFSSRCIASLNAALISRGLHRIEFETVRGERESYQHATVVQEGLVAELFVYSDEAGLSTISHGWKAFEKWDFTSEDDLIQSYVDDVIATLTGGPIAPLEPRQSPSLTRYAEIPGFLRILIALSLLSSLLVIATVLPGGMTVEGRRIDAQQWWSNGSGIVFTAIIGCFVTTGILMLKRVRFSRGYYLLGWMLLYVGSSLIEAMNGIPFSMQESLPTVAFGAAQLVVFASYLYLNKRVRAYFAPGG